MIDHDYRSERLDRAEEESGNAYIATFARISARLVAEFEAEGFGGAILPDGTMYKPDGATVHRLVMQELAPQN